jgi:MarR family transcriptional regulator, organic hydroperoxide resistance regulator
MPRPSTRDLADEAWGLMMAVIAARPAAAFAIAAEYELSPGDTKALISIEDGDASPTMSALAGAWACDASNVTWLVDRLEQRGLVERQASATDRRAKIVALTPLGIEARDRVRAAFSDTPPSLAELSVDDLEALCEVLRKTGVTAQDFGALMRGMGPRPRVPVRLRPAPPRVANP